MAFLEHYSSDVVISFAPEDNQPLPGEKEAWVNELAQTLETLLGQQGVPGATVNTRFPGNLNAAERLRILTESAVVVLVLSPAYLVSHWLDDSHERDTLLALCQARANQVFVVCKSDVRAEEPAAFRPLKHHFFWEPGAGGSYSLRLSEAGDNRPYYDKATDLAHGVASVLKGLKAGNAPAESDDDSRAPKVYLAQVPAELEALRAEVERYLNQGGIRVVPRGRLPEDVALLTALVTQELSGCRAFVELLGSTPGDAGEAPRLRAQLAVVQAAGVKDLAILQWRSPTLDLARVSETQRQLLLAPTVQAESLSDFCSTISKRVSGPLEEEQARFLPTVFVDALSGDVERVEQIFSRYAQIEWSWGQAAETISKVKKKLKELDGVLIFWGTGESTPRQERYGLFRKTWQALGKRPERLRIYDGPPPMKPRFQGANAPLINGRDGQEPAELREFIRAVTKGES